MTILAVTGLTREAEIVGAAGVVAVAGGGDAAALAAKLDALHGDIRGVISIGLARGAVAAAESGRCGDRRAHHHRLRKDLDCASGWRDRLLAAQLPGAHQGRMFGSDVILENADNQGRAVSTATGALAVDMESQVAARFAARATCRWRRCG